MKPCTCCGKVKPLNKFGKNKRKADGHKDYCKQCKANTPKNCILCPMCGKYKRMDGIEVGVNKSTNTGYQPCCNACYKISDAIDRMLNGKQRTEKRKAFLDNLVFTLTKEQYKNIIKDFDGKCVLSGVAVTEGVDLEHFVALCTGHCGTYVGNCFPMEHKLNCSKNGKNPFVWIVTESFEVQQKFWDELVPYLAQQNKMQVGEFVDFVNWCYNHKRTPEQIIADNKKYGYKVPSTTLYYDYIANTYKNI